MFRRIHGCPYQGHTMRSIATKVALALLIATPAAAEGGIWPEYSFPEAGFAAQYPGKPQVEERSYKTALTPAGSVKERVYSYNSGGVVYMVAIADFAAVKPIENRAIDEAARTVTSKGMLTHDVSARIDWHYGREIRVEDGSGTSYTDAIFYIDNKVYQIAVVFPLANTDPVGSAGIHFFQQAFRLLP
uniref:DUF1795 domain-containing protein n=1 Tax=uncultured bacterium BLR9 TaxID=506525 RepID=C0INB7_9BACT|nr:hypothetical protein AKSOIL_0158 [uncultured bacterium BLR9]